MDKEREEWESVRVDHDDDDDDIYTSDAYNNMW